MPQKVQCPECGEYFLPEEMEGNLCRECKRKEDGAIEEPRD